MAASTKDFSVNLIVGDHNQPNTKITVNFTSNYTECQDLFAKHQGQELNQESDLLLQFSFPTKSGLDDFTLGESIGFFKNKLNFYNPLFGNNKAKYTNIESERDYVTYSKVVKMTMVWNDDRDLNAVMDVITKLGFLNVDLSLEINQRIPTNNYETDDPKLTGKLTGNVRSNEMKILNFVKDFIRDHPYSDHVPGMLSTLLLSGNIDLRFRNIENLIDGGILPWPQDIPRFVGFNGLKNFALPFVGEALETLPRGEGEMNIYGIVTEIYQKLYESISGISEIKIAYKNHILTIKFTGFDLFNGYFPDIETLKNGGRSNTGW